MTEEQKRFKIKKRTSYEEQISKENKIAVMSTIFFGIAAGAVVSRFTNYSIGGEFGESLIGTASSMIGAGSLKSLIEAISRKTMLEGKVEDINTELEMPENKESRGMSR